MAVLVERRICLTENAVDKRGIQYKHGNCPEFSCLYGVLRDSLEFCVIIYRKIEKH